MLDTVVEWTAQSLVCDYSLVVQKLAFLPGFHVAAYSSLLHHGLCMNIWNATWPLMPKFSWCSSLAQCPALVFRRMSFLGTVHKVPSFWFGHFTNFPCTSEKWWWGTLLHPAPCYGGGPSGLGQPVVHGSIATILLPNFSLACSHACYFDLWMRWQGGLPRTTAMVWVIVGY